MNSLLDLKTERCPYVMSMLRHALNRAIENAYHGSLTIRTIETELEPKIEKFITMMGYSIRVTSTETIAITMDRRLTLAASYEDLPHGTTTEQLITLNFD